jgi:hypothetical protein
MVAASCMVLYGYDASVYNSVQGSKNWDNWFDKPVEVCLLRMCTVL